MRVSLIEEKEEATRELNTWFLRTLNPRAAARAYMNPCHTSPCYNVRAPDRYSTCSSSLVLQTSIVVSSKDSPTWQGR
jgi:hypothetical protein